MHKRAINDKHDSSTVSSSCSSSKKSKVVDSDVTEGDSSISSIGASSSGDVVIRAIDKVLTQLSSTSPIKACFTSQLYACCTNKTTVDSGISYLRSIHYIKTLHCNTNEGNHNLLIMKTADYYDDIDRKITLERSSNNDRKYTDKIVSSLFKFHSIVCNKLSIFVNELYDQYSLTASEVDDIISTGYLSYRRSSDADGLLWFSHPSTGKLSLWMSDTRKYILLHISKKKYKEISYHELIKNEKKMSSKMGLMYHIYDMIGNDLISYTELPTKGILLRLPK